MAAIRLYLDEDIKSAPRAVLQSRVFDVVSVHDLGRTGLSDSEQLPFREFLRRTARLMQERNQEDLSNTPDLAERIPLTDLDENLTIDVAVSAAGRRD